MDIFGVLSMLGGLALFLYGMNTMGEGLTKVSGGKLERILEKLTSSPIRAVCLGALVTAVIQSSSATTVMVVWLCEFRYYEAVAGDRNYHGCQYRYDDHIVDLKFVRD